MKEKKWQDVRKQTGYDKSLPKKRKTAFQTQKTIIDEYTGKTLEKNGRAQLDHIVSASEIENKASTNLFMTAEERAQMATNDKNLAWTDGSANQSKGNKKMKDWLHTDDKKTGMSKAEKYNVNETMALEKDNTARKFVNKTISSTAAKKYTKELLVTGGQDAARMAAYSAIGIVLKDFASEIMTTVRIILDNGSNKSLKEIFNQFKTRIQAILSSIQYKWHDILSGAFEAGLIAFLSNIVLFVINLFFTTMKKITGMIRAGFVSLCQAVKLLTNPPLGMPKDEVHYQAFKILISGIIGAGSLGLSAAIEKFLQAIPGLQPLMMFPIPSFGTEQRTVSDVLAVTLSALAGGVITTIVLYVMDMVHNKGKQDKLQIRIMAQSGVVLRCETLKTWYTLNDAYTFFTENMNKSQEMLKSSYQQISSCSLAMADARQQTDETMARLDALFNK